MDKNESGAALSVETNLFDQCTRYTNCVVEVLANSITAERRGSEADLVNARRLWYWDGAASLSQLAVDGTTAPNKCKFTVTVPSMTVLGVIEVIPCSDKAVLSIEAVPVWRR